jgi:CIC family chloride channel protein
MGDGQGVGILGGGYGAAQVAITGVDWFPGGWRGVQILFLLGLIKIFATSLTVGSGGSAGDFGPSMVMGGIFGGAFGRAAQLLLHDPRIDPGAFALVGMATFYGGLAHAPIGSLVMTCELAGSYDLLVPLMLSEAIAFVLLRRHDLYKAQIRSRRESPAHRDDMIMDVLKGVRVDAVLARDVKIVTFIRGTPGPEVVREIAAADSQDAFPVLGPDEKLVGVIMADILRTAAVDPDASALTLADDMMTTPVAVKLDDDLHRALELMLANQMSEIVVVGADEKVAGLLDQDEITAAYLAATSKPAS